MISILVPVDFSKEAEYALCFAMDIAKINEAHVLAYHVVEYPTGATIDPVGMAVPTPYDSDFVDLIKKNSSGQMELFLAECGADIDFEISVGNPYLNISDKISELNADLVVMGTKGSSGLKEFFIGSNAEKIVRTSKCPVITLSHPISDDDIKDIAFATGVVDISEQVMTKVKQLQELFHAKLHLVRINTPNHFERDQVIEKGLEEVARRYMLKDYTINIYNDVYEDQGILSFANKIDANMIAMGTRGRKGLKHLLSGSLAEDVVNHAQRPIWTFHIPPN
ncbi:MAG: universal stress protein [Bacteroidota bacterium]